MLYLFDNFALSMSKMHKTNQLLPMIISPYSHKLSAVWFIAALIGSY
jgi:hypothetical protein